jgi:MFS family permease
MGAIINSLKGMVPRNILGPVTVPGGKAGPLPGTSGQVTVDVQGEPIDERRLRQGMYTNILAGSVGMVWSAIAGGMPVTMFMDALGAGGVIIGLATTVQNVAMLMQIPAALVGELLSQRKWFYGLTMVCHRACWLIIALLPLLCGGQRHLMALCLIVLLTMSSVLAQSGIPIWYAWLADLVPHDRQSTFWSLRQSATTLPFLITMVLSGYVLDYFPDPRAAGGSYLGYELVFGAAGIFGCADILIHLMVPEPRRQSVPLCGHLIHTRILAPMRDPDFRYLTLSLCAWTFSVMVISPFAALALRNLYHATYTEISATAVVGSIGVIVGGLFGAAGMKRMGARNYGMMAMIIGPLCGTIWFFSSGDIVQVDLPFGYHWCAHQVIMLLFIVNVISGALFSSVNLAQLSLLGRISPTNGRTVSMAVHWSLVGAAAAGGPLLGGWIQDRFGYQAMTFPFCGGHEFLFIHVLYVIHLSTAWFIAAPLLYKVKHESARKNP